jgi:hypothetical protein
LDRIATTFGFGPIDVRGKQVSLEPNKNGKFPVDSMNRGLIQPLQPVVNNKKNWMMKIPLKRKVLTWYLHRGVILTKDNLSKHNW